MRRRNDAVTSLHPRPLLSLQMLSPVNLCVPLLVVGTEHNTNPHICANRLSEELPKIFTCSFWR